MIKTKQPGCIRSWTKESMNAFLHDVKHTSTPLEQLYKKHDIPRTTGWQRAEKAGLVPGRNTKVGHREKVRNKEKIMADLMAVHWLGRPMLQEHIDFFREQEIERIKRL